MTREAEFAFKQAFAYCPFSPEAVFHFMDLLLQGPVPRVDEALLILETCHKLDPFNGQISEWIDQLKRSRMGGGTMNEQVKQAFAQVQTAMSQGQTNVARQILEQLLNFGGADSNILMGVAGEYLRMGDLEKSEQVVLRLTQIMSASSQVSVQSGRHPVLSRRNFPGGRLAQEIGGT